MATDLILEITTEWFKEEANFEPCDFCGDIMMFNSNGLYMFIGLKLFDPTPAIVLCNSCCNVIEQ